jgi:hypothetical protein
VVQDTVVAATTATMVAAATATMVAAATVVATHLHQAEAQITNLFRIQNNLRQSRRGLPFYFLSNFIGNLILSININRL